MAKRRTAAQTQAVVAAVERDRAKGLAVADNCRRHGITEQSYYRWRRHTAGDADDATRPTRTPTPTWSPSSGRTGWPSWM